MLVIQCATCGRECQVRGYTTPDTFMEPGEIILDESDDWSQCCVCLQDGAEYTVLEEDDDYDYSDM